MTLYKQKMDRIISALARGEYPEDLYNSNKSMEQFVIGASPELRTGLQIMPALRRKEMRETCGSYVITDCSGTIHAKLHARLAQMGYKVRCLDLLHPESSWHYNPFVYIESEEDVLRFAGVLMRATEGKLGGDGFWEACERELLSAAISFLLSGKTSSRTMNAMVEMLDAMEVSLCEGAMTIEDVLAKAAANGAENHAIEKIRFLIQTVPPASLKASLHSCAERLRVFSSPQMQSLTKNDKLDIDAVWKEPTALFVVPPRKKDPSSVLASVLYDQMLMRLSKYCEAQAEEESNDSQRKSKGNSQTGPMLLFDDLANIEKVPDFAVKLCTVGKNVSVAFAAETARQFTNVLHWEYLLSSCLTTL